MWATDNSTTSTTPPRSRLSAMNLRTVFAASIGNVLEIYDFIAFGIFAVPISKSFFPAGSEFASLMLTFVTFAMGFLVRPVGAIVLGRYADRAGRKKALSFTLLMMAAGTLVPAFCPTYAMIGLAAPVIVLLGRLLQGFSAGGEIGGVVAMLVESAPATRKGFFASFQQASQGGGVLIAGLIGLLLTHLFSEAQINGGAWRIAFLLGLLIAPVGWYVRRRVDETPLFNAATPTPSGAAAAQSASWSAMFIVHARPLLAGVGIMVFWTIATYVSNYFTTYSVRELHLSLFDSYLGQISYGVTMIIASPAVGLISDRIGARKPMLFGAAVTALIAYPLFYLLAHHANAGSLIFVQVTIAFLLACYASCASRVMSDLFPIDFRASGVGFSYAVGVTVFGGFTPLLVTSLIGFTGDKLTVGLYLSAAAVVSCVALAMLRQRDPLLHSAHS